MSIGNGAPAWPSVIVSNDRISRSEHTADVAGAVEALEEVRQVSAGDAEAVVCDLQDRCGRPAIVLCAQP